ncbi:MAG: hypothetical protein U9R48_06870 [Chloroflexota bacterium]|nr:hypothetical protein [Chloroflexota bacterium]
MQTIVNVLADLPPAAVEMVGMWVAALLTLAVLSFILGDNPLFRLAEYLFVGVAAGYAASLAWSNVLWPRLRLLVTEPGAYWYYGVFFALGILLLARGVKPLSFLGDLPLGVLFGTGAALALGGVITGTLLPQLRASFLSVSPSDYGEGVLGWACAIDALLIVLGTIAVVVVFHFSAPEDPKSRSWGYWLLNLFQGVGRKVMMVGFGALLAGAAFSFFAVLKGRLAFLCDWITHVVDVGL